MYQRNMPTYSMNPAVLLVVVFGLFICDVKYVASAAAASTEVVEGHCPKPYIGNDGRVVTYVHIPKTAGSSFKRDLQNVRVVRSEENCFEDLYGPSAYMTTFFRDPRAHVYSQYLQNRVGGECKVPKGDSPEDGFEQWIDHFYAGLTRNGTMTETYSFNCYHPYNFQTRVMSRLCNRQNNNHPRDNGYRSHWFSDKIQTVGEMETHLADNMYKLDFVGITEYYAASFCIFEWLNGIKVVGSVCDTQQARKLILSPQNQRRQLADESDRAELSHVNDRHKPHLNVSLAVWHKVDALTYYDQQLYALALRRFACGINQFEASNNVSLGHLLGGGGAEILYDRADEILGVYDMLKEMREEELSIGS